MGWAVGGRVVHPGHPEWGAGKVVGINAGHSVVVAFSHSPTISVLPEFLKKATGRDALRPVSLPPARRSARTTAPFSQYRDAFLEEFPKGFRDREYLRRIRTYKEEAAEYLVSELSVGRMRRLLASGDHAEICRRARGAVAKTNLLHWIEMTKLADALKAKARQKGFAEALFSLLHGQDDLALRFGTFADFLVDAGAGRWTTVTYFLFMKDPGGHVLVKPKLFQRFAEVIGEEINYRMEPNWHTYHNCLNLAVRLKGMLSDLCPRDLMDVHSFMWFTGRDR